MELIVQNRIIPVVVVETPEEALATAEALLGGGISIIEITLRTPHAIDALTAVRDRFPEMAVGGRGPCLRRTRSIRSVRPVCHLRSPPVLTKQL